MQKMKQITIMAMLLLLAACSGGQQEEEQVGPSALEQEMTAL